MAAQNEYITKRVLVTSTLVPSIVSDVGGFMVEGSLLSFGRGKRGDEMRMHARERLLRWMRAVNLGRDHSILVRR